MSYNTDERKPVRLIEPLLLEMCSLVGEKGTAELMGISKGTLRGWLGNRQALIPAEDAKRAVFALRDLRNDIRRDLKELCSLRPDAMENLGALGIDYIELTEILTQPIPPPFTRRQAETIRKLLREAREEKKGDNRHAGRVKKPKNRPA